LTIPCSKTKILKTETTHTKAVFN